VILLLQLMLDPSVDKSGYILILVDLFMSYTSFTEIRIRLTRVWL